MERNTEKPTGLEWKPIPTNQNNPLIQGHNYQKTFIFGRYILFFGTPARPGLGPSHGSILVFNLEENRWEEAYLSAPAQFMKQNSFSITTYHDMMLLYGANPLPMPIQTLNRTIQMPNVPGMGQMNQQIGAPIQNVQMGNNLNRGMQMPGIGGMNQQIGFPMQAGQAGNDLNRGLQMPNVPEIGQMNQQMGAPMQPAQVGNNLNRGIQMPGIGPINQQRGTLQLQPNMAYDMRNQNASYIETVLLVKQEEAINDDSYCTVECEQINISGQQLALPIRRHHTINVHEERMYSFAGQDELGSLIFQEPIPTSLPIQIISPDVHITARIAHHSALIDRKIYYYGGVNEQKKFITEIDVLDIQALKWNTLQPKDGFLDLSASLNLLESIGDTLFFLNIHKNSTFLYTYQTSEDAWESLSINDKIPRSGTKILLGSYQGKLVFGLGYNLYQLELDKEKKAQSKIDNASIACEARSSNFKENDRRLFLEKPYPDVIFNVEGKQVPAHKGLLAMRCSFFEKLFTSRVRIILDDVMFLGEEVKENSSAIIEIADIKLEIFTALLEYIYCNAVTFTEHIGLELLVFSAKHALPNLRTLCEEFLMKRINKENVINIANVAEKCEATILKKDALKFISRNSSTIFESQEIKELSSTLIVELVNLKP